MSITYNFNTSVAWAVKALALTPTPTIAVGVTTAVNVFGAGSSVSLPALSGGTAAPAGLNPADGTSAAIGDLMLVAIATFGSGQTVTPPAGWTALPVAAGNGTTPVICAVFYKVAAVAGDISNATTFALSVSAGYAATNTTITTGSFDASALVTAQGSNGSTSDGTTAHGPGTSIAPVGTPVIEYVANTSGGAASITSSSGETHQQFLNQQNDGAIGGGNGQPRVGISGWRYIVLTPPDGWHLGAIAAGAYWS